MDDLTNRGSYTGSASPYGTFDQGGNVFEWNEAIIGSDRGMRGGNFVGSDGGVGNLAASSRGFTDPEIDDFDDTGFRVAPEPGRGLLLVVGVLSVFGLDGWRRGRA